MKRVVGVSIGSGLAFVAGMAAAWYAVAYPHRSGRGPEEPPLLRAGAVVVFRGTLAGPPEGKDAVSLVPGMREVRYAVDEVLFGPEWCPTGSVAQVAYLSDDGSIPSFPTNAVLLVSSWLALDRGGVSWCELPNMVYWDGILATGDEMARHPDLRAAVRINELTRIEADAATAAAAACSAVGRWYRNPTCKVGAAVQGPFGWAMDVRVLDAPVGARREGAAGAAVLWHRVYVDAKGRVRTVSEAWTDTPAGITAHQGQP